MLYFIMATQKGTSGCKNTSFEPLNVKIVLKLTCSSDENDALTKNPNGNAFFFAHAQIRNG